MRKHAMKKILLGSVGAVLLLTLLFPSVAAMTGSEVDVWGTISALFARVNTQEEKIEKLELRIDELLAQIEQTKNPPEIIDKPIPDEDPDEKPPVEVKPEEPQPVDPKPETDLVVNAKLVDSGLKVFWTASTRVDLQGYKVVISKSNPSPSYPDDGYLVWITNPEVTYTIVKAGQKYNGGDIGGVLQADTSYKIAITYVFEKESITTEAITAKIPKAVTEPKPPLDPTSLKVVAKVTEDYVKLAWTPEPSPTLLGYKVVLSTSNPNPSYPDDGYLTWITNPATSYTVIEKGAEINGGDIEGHLAGNTSYYAAITYIYTTGSVTTPGIQFTTPASFDSIEEDPPLAPEQLILKVTIVEDVLQLAWTQEPSSLLEGYKIVISETNPSPSYPDDGYLTWITDRNTTSFVVNNLLIYNGGDINSFLKRDTVYFFAITYVYSDRKVTTVPVMVTTPSSFPISQ